MMNKNFLPKKKKKFFPQNILKKTGKKFPIKTESKGKTNFLLKYNNKTKKLIRIRMKTKIRNQQIIRVFVKKILGINFFWAIRTKNNFENFFETEIMRKIKLII